MREGWWSKDRRQREKQDDNTWRARTDAAALARETTELRQVRKGNGVHEFFCDTERRTEQGKHES